jgi:DNA polymerase type B, organellar and viral
MGYKIQILNGYLFDKKVIFKEYVDKMYSLRLLYPKTDPMNLIAKLLMNSLYGKFGMNTEKTKVEIYNTDKSEELAVLNNTLEVWGEAVSDHITIGNHIVIVRKNLSIVKYNEDEDLFYGSDINVGIASMITAGARMHMTQFKNRSDYNLYYTDTDSVVVDRPLQQDMVGDSLGQLKLEHEIEKAVFIAPKVYGFLTENNKQILKVKGVKSEVLQSRIDLKDLTALLVKDSSMELTQDKWMKKAIEGNITIQEAAYNLKATAFKRAPIYNINGVFVNTRPYNFDEIIK